VSAAPVAAALPGWFGKLPGMGDFAHRRLPDTFRETWDHWLHDGLMRLRERHADWTARYLEAPLWCFVLGRGVAGDRCWLGVLMPSVDGVGRYFPFTVAIAFDDGDAPPAPLAWWALAAQAALDGLEHDLDALRFEALLQRLFDEGAAAADGSVFDGESADRDRDDLRPLPGQALWLAAPEDADAARMTTAGLPQGVAFDALFGFGDASRPTEMQP
jgi:type VI secretion system protein ImpM